MSAPLSPLAAPRALAVRRALLGGAVALALLIPAACGGGGDRTDSGGPPTDPLDGTVLPAAQQTVIDALALAPLRCSDLADRAEASAAVAAAAGELGLTPDDERWATVGPALTAGIAANQDGKACRPQIAAWIRPAGADVVVPTFAPTTSNPPTTTTTAAVTTTTTDPAPQVLLGQAEQVRAGMSLAQVQELFGSTGDITQVGLSPEDDDVIVVWPGCCLPFANVRVQAHNGKVTAVRTFNLSAKRS